MDREVEGGGQGGRRQLSGSSFSTSGRSSRLLAHLLRKVYVPVLVGEVDVPVAEEPGQSQEADPIKKNGTTSPLVSVRLSVCCLFLSSLPDGSSRPPLRDGVVTGERGDVCVRGRVVGGMP